MSLVATRIEKVVVDVNRFDKNEHRLSEYGALNFFVASSNNAPLLTKEMRDKAIMSANQTLQIPVLKYDGTISVSNSRSCSVADAENTSTLVDVTFVTYSVGFTMVPTLYSNNHIGYEKDFEAKLKKCARVLGAALDSAAIAALEAAKTQVYAESLLYDTTGDVLTANWESRENILGDIEPIMAANDFYGRVHIIGNIGVKSLLNQLLKNGEFNAKDDRLEWAGKTFWYTNRITNEDTDYATFYAVEEGNVDILYAYDRETALSSAMGKAITSLGHSWEVVDMPYLGIPVGLHYYESVGDQSSIAGGASADMTCVRKQYYGFSVDVAFVVAYNSALTTRANPIISGAITKGDAYAKPVQVVGVVSTKEVEEAAE